MPPEIWFETQSHNGSALYSNVRENELTFIEGHQVRYGPSRLLFDTAEGLQGSDLTLKSLHSLSSRLTYCVLDIYNHRSNVIKAANYETLVHRAPNTLTQRDKKLHGTKRRVISQGFSDNALRVFEAPVTAQILKFSALLGGTKNDDGTENEHLVQDSGDNWSPPRDMAAWCG